MFTFSMKNLDQLYPFYNTLCHTSDHKLHSLVSVFFKLLIPWQIDSYSSTFSFVSLHTNKAPFKVTSIAVIVWSMHNG